MAWFVGDRRGPPWKQGWGARALYSLSLPPAPLLAVFFIVMLFLSLSSRAAYKERVERAEVAFRLLLLVLVPLLLVFPTSLLVVNGGLMLPWERRQRTARMLRDISTSWGVAAAVVLLLFMIYFRWSLESSWFRPLWRRM